MSHYHEEIAAQCLRRLRAAHDKQAEMSHLIDEINALVYGDGGRLLTRQDRLLIVDLVIARTTRRAPAGADYYEPDILSGDNSKYLQVVASLKSMIR